MWDWIRAYEIPVYGTFWKTLGMIEYKFIYGKTITSEIKEILDKAGMSSADQQVRNLMNEYMKDACKEASIHFGQPYFNTATMAGMFRIMLKKLAQTFGVAFPVNNTKNEQVRPWWMVE